MGSAQPDASAWTYPGTTSRTSLSTLSTLRRSSAWAARKSARLWDLSTEMRMHVVKFSQGKRDAGDGLPSAGDGTYTPEVCCPVALAAAGAPASAEFCALASQSLAASAAVVIAEATGSLHS
jgi:hypothetical protein